MRITQSLMQSQFLASLNTMQSNLAQTQNGISTGLAFTTPAQNPAAAGAVALYNQVLSQSQQYSSNATSAQTSLNYESNALTQIYSQLSSLRSIALQANSGTVSGQNLQTLSAQAAQIENSLLALANTQDGSGNYIFGGYATQTQPFTLTATGASYAGDQGQQIVPIAAGQTVAAGDSGSAVFNQIPTGNGTFTTTAGASNTGSGVIGSTSVTNPTNYTGNSYSINFTSPTTYNIVDTTTGTTLTTGASYTTGQAISFAGVQITLTGQPSASDTFVVAPSTQQSLFTTVQNLISTLNAGTSGSTSKTPLNNAITGALNNIDQALNGISTTQASVGGRMNLITAQQTVATTQQTQLKTSISSLQSLDYASAITTLDSENTTLSAALQTYAQTQALTLFKYIS